MDKAVVFTLTFMAVAGAGAYEAGNPKDKLSNPGSVTGSGGFRDKLLMPQAGQKDKLPKLDLSLNRSKALLAEDGRAEDLKAQSVDGPAAHKDTDAGPEVADVDALEGDVPEGAVQELLSKSGTLSASDIDRIRDRIGRGEDVSKVVPETAPVKRKDTQAGKRAIAKASAKAYKLEVDVSKRNSLGDGYYKESVGAMWQKADKLYNLAVGWIDE